MIFLVIAAVIFIADSLIKHWIEHHMEAGKDVPVCKGRILVTKMYNKGAFLNFLDHKTKVVTVISSVMLGGVLGVFLCEIPKRGGNFLKLALSFVLGGALSNVADRVRKGYVVDYFSFRWLKKIVFNLGDLFIFLGALMMILWSLFPTHSK